MEHHASLESSATDISAVLPSPLPPNTPSTTTRSPNRSLPPLPSGHVDSLPSLRSLSNTSLSDVSVTESHLSAHTHFVGPRRYEASLSRLTLRFLSADLERGYLLSFVKPFYLRSLLIAILTMVGYSMAILLAGSKSGFQSWLTITPSQLISFQLPNVFSVLAMSITFLAFLLRYCCVRARKKEEKKTVQFHDFYPPIVSVLLSEFSYFGFHLGMVILNILPVRMDVARTMAGEKASILFLALILRPPFIHLLVILSFNFVMFTTRGLLWQFRDGTSTTLLTSFGIVSNLITCFMLVSLAYFHEMNERNGWFKKEILNEKNGELIEGVKLSRRLLLNVFPKPFVSRICVFDGDDDDDGEEEEEEELMTSIIPNVPLLYNESFREMSFLEADIVGFTAYCDISGKDGKSVMFALNEIYSTFDSTALDLSIHKLKTVGDAWLGITDPFATDPQAPMSLLRFAIEMIRIICQKNQIYGWEFQLRVGISCADGRVALLGRSRLTLEVFGEVAQEAVWLEQTSRPQCIHVNERFYELTFEIGEVEGGEYQFVRSDESNAVTYFLSPPGIVREDEIPMIEIVEVEEPSEALWRREVDGVCSSSSREEEDTKEEDDDDDDDDDVSLEMDISRLRLWIHSLFWIDWKYWNGLKPTDKRFCCDCGFWKYVTRGSWEGFVLIAAQVCVFLLCILSFLYCFWSDFHLEYYQSDRLVIILAVVAILSFCCSALMLIRSTALNLILSCLQVALNLGFIFLLSFLSRQTWSSLSTVTVIWSLMVVHSSLPMPWIVVVIAMLFLCGSHYFIFTRVVYASYVASLSSSDQSRVTFNLIYYFGLAFVFAVALFFQRMVVSRGYFHRIELDHRMDDVRGEEERNKRLLLSVLPHRVVGLLRKQLSSPLDSNRKLMLSSFFPEATVAFLDVDLHSDRPKGSRDVFSDESLRFLNSYFSFLDDRVRSFGCEKVKSIVNKYLLCCTGRNMTPSKSVECVVRFSSFALHAALRHFTTHDDDNKTHSASVRIGVCQGPVCAGILGTSSFLYDIVSDVCNTASRMCCVAPNWSILMPKRVGEVWCFEEGMQRKSGKGREERIVEVGRMEVKGKGEMEIVQILWRINDD